MTFLEWVEREVLKAFGAFHAPNSAGEVQYYASSHDADRARRLYAERVERQHNARLLHAWKLAS